MTFKKFFLIYSMLNFFKIISFILIFIFIFFKLLVFILSTDAFSNEFIYTFNAVFQYCFPPFFALAFFFATTLFSIRKIFFRTIVSFAFFFGAIPVCSPSSQDLTWLYGYAFSVCWILCFFFLAISFFIISANSAKSFIASGILSLVASVILAIACMEVFMLATRQTTDGVHDDTNHSKYIHQPNVFDHAKFQRNKGGDFPASLGHPYSVAHRVMRFDELLYDVKYTFDAQGHRIIPQLKAHNSHTLTHTLSHEIMLFGCSFTFGHGLDNEQTWAWKLSHLLGADVKVTNYGMSAFGAHQMLTMLEDAMVSMPSTQKSMAFFLAIEGHLPRNAGYLNAPFVHNARYVLDNDGGLHRDGFASDNPIRNLYKLSNLFNGSRLVRHLVNLAFEKIIAIRHEEFLDTYLAILDHAAKLLRQKYHTELTVLVWPDFEYIAPLLKQKGISFALVRPWLKAWDTEGPGIYRLHPEADAHPNQRATRELAEGLAKFYRDLQ